MYPKNNRIKLKALLTENLNFTKIIFVFNNKLISQKKKYADVSHKKVLPVLLPLSFLDH